MTDSNPPASILSSPQVLLTPLKSALLAGHAQRLAVLLRVQAPDAQPGAGRTRPPYHLALVLDRSGSMSGEPLHEAKRCAAHIVDQLRPDDRASLVQFDNQANVLVPALPVGDGQHMHQALSGIHEGGMTNLHGGWEAGAQGLLEHVRQAGLSRVILLSDGNANQGLTDAGEIARQCGRLADQGVTTSSYGLGRDFNEDLMVAMARAGQGNHYYGDTARDLFEPFAEEFDLLTNLYARKLRLSLRAPEGIKATLLNDYAVQDPRGFPVACLPDLAWGAEAWALVQLDIQAPPAGIEAIFLLHIELTASDLDGKPIAFPEARLKLPALPSRVWETLLPDPLVLQRHAELEAGKLLEQARAAAGQGDWHAIERLLREARKRYAGHPWVLQVLESLVGLAKQRDAARFGKEAMYSTRRMNTRLAARNETPSMGEEATLPAYLRRKEAQGKAQFRTEAQDNGAPLPRPAAAVEATRHSDTRDDARDQPDTTSADQRADQPDRQPRP